MAAAKVRMTVVSFPIAANVTAPAVMMKTIATAAQAIAGDFTVIFLCYADLIVPVLVKDKVVGKEPEP